MTSSETLAICKLGTVVALVVASVINVSVGSVAKLRPNVQVRNPAVADIGKRNGKTIMFAVYNVTEDHRDCEIRKSTGTIIKIHYDEELGVRIDGFTLLGARGERTYFNVDQSIYEDFRLPRSDIGWLPTLIAKSNRVRIDAYVCGASGGVEMAHNIISLQAKRSQSTKPRRR